MLNFIKRKYYKNYKLKPGDAILGYDHFTDKPNVISFEDRFNNTLLVGVSGCGLHAFSLYPMMLNDFRNKNLGVSVFTDYSYDIDYIYSLAKKPGRNDINFFDPSYENSLCFNPLIGDEKIVIDELKFAFSDYMDRFSTPINEKDLDLLKKSVKIAKFVYGDNSSMFDIYNLITNENKSGRKIIEEAINKGADNKEILENCDWFVNKYYKTRKNISSGSVNYKECANIRKAIINAMNNERFRECLYARGQENNLLDMDKILENGEVLIAGSSCRSSWEVTHFLGSLLVTSYEAAVFRRQNKEKTNIFYSDQFSRYFNHGYEKMTSNSKKYNVISVFNVGGVTNRIRAYEGTEYENDIKTTFENCKNIILYSGCSIEDVRRFSKYIAPPKTKAEKKYIKRVLDKEEINSYDLACGKVGNVYIAKTINGIQEPMKLASVKLLSKELQKECSNICDDLNQKFRKRFISE